MRWPLVALAVCGCGAIDGAASDPQPDVNGFDLLISSTYVRVYPHYVGVTGGPVEWPHVTDAGQCADLDTDTASIITTELSSVAVDGLALSNGNPDPARQVDRKSVG